MLMSRISRLSIVFALAAAATAVNAQTSTITEIVVNGNKAVAKEAILAAMSTKVGQPFAQENIAKDREAILAMGFFKAVDVRPSLIEGTSWRVYVDVSEFDVVKEIRIAGNTVFTTEEIMKAVTIKADQPFNLRDQKPTNDAIRKMYQEKGYFALVDQLEPLEDSPQTVSIVIREMTINKITITGNTRTSPRVLNRMIKSEPGQVFNEQKWIEDLQKLFSTQWFEKITPTDSTADEGFAVNLGVDLKEARTGNIIFGATVDPRQGLGGTLRLIDTNFRGTGQTVGINASQTVNGGGTSGEIEYANPFADNRGTSINVSVYSHLLYRFLSDSFTTGSSSERYVERRTGGALAFSRPIGEKINGSLGLRFEAINTTELNLSNPQSFVQQDGTLLTLQAGFLRNRRDLDLDPAQGDWMNLLVEPGFANITKNSGAFTGPDLLGNKTFVRSQVEWRGYWSPQGPRTVKELDAARRVIAVRFKYGLISGDAPFYEQFFSGGGSTVRGYQDDRFWGKQTALASIEYRHPIQKNFNVIGFVDYGGAWGGFGTVNNFDQSDKFKLHLGYGLGFSFKTPLGPIRLDFGFGDKGRSRTHFQIGTSF